MEYLMKYKVGLRPLHFELEGLYWQLSTNSNWVKTLAAVDYLIKTFVHSLSNRHLLKYLAKTFQKQISEKKDIYILYPTNISKVYQFSRQEKEDSYSALFHYSRNVCLELLLIKIYNTNLCVYCFTP
jgi:hypothetical protein